MGIKKGRWVDDRYVDGNGNELLIPPTGMFNRVKKKDINEPVESIGEILEDLEKKKKRYKKLKNIEKKKIHYPKPEDLDQESFVELVYDLFIVLREKVFTIPVLTMIGVWIIVLYIILL